MSYSPNTVREKREMLNAIGAGSLEELFDAVPRELCLGRPLDIPGPLSEMDLMKHSVALNCRNADLDSHVCFLGAGVYDHYIPATVPAIIGRSEFYTSYTPYQPEVSQGNLQAIYEFQSLVCQLTGMDVANASMYDGATALAEAAIMASAITGRSGWIASGCIHPAYLETLRTYAWTTGCDLSEPGRKGVCTDVQELASRITDETACVMVQSPNFFGMIESLSEISAKAHERGALLIVVFDPISLGLLKPPAEYDADICVAEGQPLGVPPGFGGPLVGLFACKRQYVRQMPGRVVGMTTDTEGRRGYTLTLQTREQHIRREKATSNICTNEALYALAATVYLSTLGKHGLRRVAELCLHKAHYAAERIAGLPGFEVVSSGRFFKEFVVKCDRPPAEINEALLERGIIGGLDLGEPYPELQNHMLVCVTEKRSREEIDELVGGLSS